MSKPNFDREELDGLAAEYALGALDGAERQAFEREIATNPAAREAVVKWRTMLGLFSDAPAVEPDRAVWRNIEAALDAPDREHRPVSTIRAGEGPWVEILPGVEKQLLFVDRDAGTESFYLRLAAGATIPAHDHAIAEECVMLSGEIWIGDLKLTAGDYHVSHAGTRHAEVRSPNGATAYLRAALDEAA